MDSQLDVEYEVIDPVTNQQYITDTRYEALAFYKDGWLVVERHVTKYKPSAHTQTEVIVRMSWNNNPEFGGV